jgi:predicted oxidoreductase (fatty acid repression mutant protein)
MDKNFLSAVADRRTYYSISKDPVVSDDRIREIVEHAVKHTPSAFNSQSARLIILLGGQHDKLWDITKEALRKVVPADQFEPTENKINSFRNGYGTILYFEDQSVVEALQIQFPTYSANFPVWSQQSSGMHQYVIWTALEIEGFGASLQHYGELIGADVRREWKVPANWKLIAQMPFGKPVAQPDAKQFKPLEERIRIYK